MKSICMFTPTSGGGHARYSWELMTAMVAEPHDGYRLELVSSRDLDPQFKSDQYPVHAMLPPIADKKNFSTKLGWIANRLAHYPTREWQTLKWLQSRPEITAVHFQEWTPWLAAPMFRKIKAMGKKVYFTAHNIFPHRYPKLVPKSVMNGWIKSGCLEADGLFVLTDILAKQLADFLGKSHPPIHVVPHGVWTIPDLAQKSPPLEERLKLKRLLAFGALRPNKGVDLLLRAAEQLPGYRITIAGEPCHAEYFATEILPRVRKLRDMGMQVDLLDRFIPDAEVEDLFASHSAVVLPYTSGFAAQSGVAFMALAYELPVVAAEVGGLRDLFEDHKIGVTFRDPTPQALASAVAKLHCECSPFDLTRELRAAKQQYSWQIAARATLAGYGIKTEDPISQHDCATTTACSR